MQEKSESLEAEQEQSIKGEALKKLIRSMNKNKAIAYFMDAQKWYGTPRPMQIAVLIRAGLKNLPAALELYVRASIEDWAKIDLPMIEAEDSIAEFLGVSDGGINKATSRIMRRIVRKGKNGKRRRPWALKGKHLPPNGRPTPSQTKGLPPPERKAYLPPNEMPHKRKMDKRKIEKSKIEDKEESIPSFSGDSSFKKEDKDKAQKHLKGFDLHNPLYFCRAYFGLLKMFKRIDLTEKDLDLKIASECLNKVPQEFRRQAILADWMIWYVLTPPRPKGTLFLSYFKKSWDDFSPIAIDLLETITAPERQQREAEAKASQEQQDKEDEEERILMEEQHRQRQEQAKADKETKRQKAIEAEEARKKKAIEEEEARKKRAALELEAKRRQAEVFLKSLPSPEAIRQAVNKVPLTPNWLDNQFGYMDFMNAMLDSVQFVNLTAPIGPEYLNYTPLARDSFGGDYGAFELKSRDFVVAEVENAMGELKARGLSRFPKQTLDWKRFAQYFGIPENAQYERPKTMVAVVAEGNNESPFGEKDEEDD